MVKNIIITERQLKTITEITLLSEVNFENSWKIIFNYIEENFPAPIVEKEIKKYFKKQLGFKLDDGEIKKILDSFPYLDVSEIKSLENEDILSNLAYHMAKNLIGIFKLGNLRCTKFIEDDEFTRYIFFDGELQESIGHFLIKPAPESSYRGVPVVSISALDKQIKGMGFGKEMYLSLLSDNKLLGSDNTLTNESLNIWVNVLPKYAYVFAKMENGGVVSMMGNKKPHYERVERYFATLSEKIFKRYMP